MKIHNNFVFVLGLGLAVSGMTNYVKAGEPILNDTSDNAVSLNLLPETLLDKVVKEFPTAGILVDANRYPQFRQQILKEIADYQERDGSDPLTHWIYNEIARNADHSPFDDQMQIKALSALNELANQVAPQLALSNDEYDRTDAATYGFNASNIFLIKSPNLERGLGWNKERVAKESLKAIETAVGAYPDSVELRITYLQNTLFIDQALKVRPDYLCALEMANAGAKELKSGTMNAVARGRLFNILAQKGKIALRQAETALTDLSANELMTAADALEVAHAAFTEAKALYPGQEKTDMSGSIEGVEVAMRLETDHEKLIYIQNNPFFNSNEYVPSIEELSQGSVDLHNH